MKFFTLLAICLIAFSTVNGDVAMAPVVKISDITVPDSVFDDAPATQNAGEPMSVADVDEIADLVDESTIVAEEIDNGAELDDTLFDVHGEELDDDELDLRDEYSSMTGAGEFLPYPDELHDEDAIQCADDDVECIFDVNDMDSDALCEDDDDNCVDGLIDEDDDEDEEDDEDAAAEAGDIEAGDADADDDDDDDDEEAVEETTATDGAVSADVESDDDDKVRAFGASGYRKKRRKLRRRLRRERRATRRNHRAIRRDARKSGKAERRAIRRSRKAARKAARQTRRRTRRARRSQKATNRINRRHKRRSNRQQRRHDRKLRRQENRAARRAGLVGAVSGLAGFVRRNTDLRRKYQAQRRALAMRTKKTCEKNPKHRLCKGLKNRLRYRNLSCARLQSLLNRRQGRPFINKFRNKMNRFRANFGMASIFKRKLLFRMRNPNSAEGKAAYQRWLAKNGNGAGSSGLTSSNQKQLIRKAMVLKRCNKGRPNPRGTMNKWFQRIRQRRCARRNKLRAARNLPKNCRPLPPGTTPPGTEPTGTVAVNANAANTVGLTETIPDSCPAAGDNSCTGGDTCKASQRCCQGSCYDEAKDSAFPILYIAIIAGAVVLLLFGGIAACMWNKGSRGGGMQRGGGDGVYQSNPGMAYM